MRKSILIFVFFLISFFQAMSQDDVSQYFSGSKSSNASQYFGINILKMPAGCLFFEYSRDFFDVVYARVGGGPILFNGFSLSEDVFMEDIPFDYHSGFEFEASIGFSYEPNNNSIIENGDIGLFYNMKSNKGDTSTLIKNSFGVAYGYLVPLTTQWYIRPHASVGFSNSKIKGENLPNNIYDFSETSLYYSLGISILRTF